MTVRAFLTRSEVHEAGSLGREVWNPGALGEVLSKARIPSLSGKPQFCS